MQSSTCFFAELGFFKKYNTELIDIMVQHFECSKLQVKDYLDLIAKDELMEILEKYGMNEKTIKRLLR